MLCKPVPDIHCQKQYVSWAKKTGLFKFCASKISKGSWSESGHNVCCGSELNCSDPQRCGFLTMGSDAFYQLKICLKAVHQQFKRKLNTLFYTNLHTKWIRAKCTFVRSSRAVTAARRFRVWNSWGTLQRAGYGPTSLVHDELKPEVIFKIH